MISALTNKRIRTHRHIRSMRSLLTSTGPGRARWPRLRETEQIQGVLGARPYPRPRSHKEIAS